MPNRRRVALLGAATLAAGALPGCAFLQRPGPIPMDLIYDDRACPATRAPVLLVLLPGVYMPPQEMLQEGLVAAVRQRGLAADVLVADANIGYVQDGSLLRRLDDEVIGAARRWGYSRIWLAGISLGGFVALNYARQRPGAIEGIVAIAPYLGRRALIDEIIAAGGPAAWRRTATPRGDPKSDGDVERAVWTWLAALPSDAPPLWLNAGSEDRFAAGHRLLAGLLPTDRSSFVPGDHDWPPWRRLWSRWLDRGLLPTGCTA